MQATITVPKSSENKTAIDQELEEQYKALQSNLYALKGHVDVGNVELLQQEEQLKKMDKNLTKIENNNIKANWMINSGRSTWGMIKSLFTKPTLVKDPVEPEETNQEGPEVEEGQVKFLESKDRLDEILRVTGDIKSGVKNQQAAIERTTKMVEKIDQREKKIIKEQQKLNDKITKWAK